MAKKKRYKLPVFDSIEKELELYNEHLTLQIDFDDVNHFVVEELTKLLVKALNDIPQDVWDAAIAKGQKKYDNEWGDY
jgi:hypothetical protein